MQTITAILTVVLLLCIIPHSLSQWRSCTVETVISPPSCDVSGPPSCTKSINQAICVNNGNQCTTAELKTFCQTPVRGYCRTTTPDSTAIDDAHNLLSNPCFAMVTSIREECSGVEMGDFCCGCYYENQDDNVGLDINYCAP